MSTHPCVSIPRVYACIIVYCIHADRCESACVYTSDKSFKKNIAVFSQPVFALRVLPLHLRALRIARSTDRWGQPVDSNEPAYRWSVVISYR